MSLKRRGKNRKDLPYLSNRKMDMKIGALNYLYEPKSRSIFGGKENRKINLMQASVSIIIILDKQAASTCGQRSIKIKIFTISVLNGMERSFFFPMYNTYSVVMFNKEISRHGQKALLWQIATCSLFTYYWLNNCVRSNCSFIDRSCNDLKRYLLFKSKSVSSLTCNLKVVYPVQRFR